MFFHKDNLRFTVMRALVGVGGLFFMLAPTAAAAPPTNLFLSNTVIQENDPNGNFIGKLTPVDPDVNDRFTYFLVSGQGDADNEHFSIYQDELLLYYVPPGPDGPYLDYEKQTTYSVRLRVRDSSGSFFEKVFVITMIDDELEDEDNDGLNELEEQSLGLNNKKADTDGDGFIDPIEIQKGSQPNDIISWPDYPLVAWGDNQTGELRAPATADFAKLATGQNHSLGLRFNGTVAAWAGWNEYGQITVPPGLSGVVSVAAGEDFWLDESSHSLALKVDGTVVGWGFNENDYHTIPVGLVDVVEIAAGRSHNLALKSNGTVVAWGNNDFGQCAVPAGLQGVVAVEAGGFYSLALKSDGTVVAWGSNFDGIKWIPIPVPAGLRDVVAISAGRFHALALKADGTVVAWGYGQFNQTVVPPGLSGVVSVKAGGFHSLALKSDGSVVAWGANDKGQTNVPPSANSQVVTISAGFRHSLAIRQSATQPRIVSSPQISTTPGEALNYPVTVENAVAIRFTAVGLPAGLTIDPVTGIISGTVSGALRQSVRILVDTNQGRLTQDLWLRVFQGASPTAVSLSPALVMENSPKGIVVGNFSATDADAGDTHVYELVDGSGSQDNGRFVINGNQLVVKELIDRDFEKDSSAFSIRVRALDGSLNFHEAVIPIQFGDDLQEDVDRDGLIEALEVQAGTSDLDYDSDNDTYGDGLEIRMGKLPLVASNFPNGQMLVAWGNNDRGQLTVPAGLGEISQVAGGWAHSLALKVNGTVAAWGWNAKGQSTVPANLTGVVAIDAGYEHSLALKSDGTVVAWGDNSKAQASVPENLNGVVAIAAGGYFNLALKSDGTVVAWGDNENDETTLPPGLNNVVAIAAGGFHGLALKGDGSVVAWGWSGATAVPDTAVQIVAISAGGIHSIALKRDGTVIPWGRNDEGQLYVPPTVSPVAELGTGLYHSMVMKTTGATLAWGDDEFGQSSAPTDAQSVRFLATSANHNLAIRQASGFPAFGPRATVMGWPGQTLNYQVVFSGATVNAYSATGLPAGLSIHPQTGLISGPVTGSGDRKAVRLMADTNKGRISQVVWLNTADGRPPTDISLTGRPASVLENAPVGTVLGTVGVVDVDVGDAFTFDVQVTSGSTIPGCLSVIGGQLVVTNNSGLDFENGLAGVLTAKVGVTDLGGNYFSKSFTIQLSDDRTEDADGDGVTEAMEEDVFFSKDTAKDDYVTLDKDGDGIPALTEYSFNLNPQVADGGRYLGTVGSTAGLPVIKTFVDAQGHRRLRLEYLRRTGSGLTYVPQFSSDLKTWTQPSQPVQITWTSGVWERCLIEDYQFTPSPGARFGRVRIDYIPPGTTNGLPPTSIGLVAAAQAGGPATLMENSPPGTVVGNLSTLDPDPGDTHTYTVVVLSGAPSGSLAISGSQLVTAPGSSFNHEASSANLVIRVRSTDSTQNFHEQIFVIPLIDDRTEDTDGDGMDEQTEEDFLFTSDDVFNNFTTADADQDGVSTLLEYAFNLDPQASDSGLVLGGVGSTSGLPRVYPIIDAQGHRRLRMEYLRRIGSGLTYRPFFSSSLAPGSWVSGTSGVQVVWSNAEWERCVVDDTEFTPGPAVRFGRVSVSK
jgi:alpha-tubulin suppressor-like RCC1 family protein